MPVSVPRLLASCMWLLAPFACGGGTDATPSTACRLESCTGGQFCDDRYDWCLENPYSYEAHCAPRATACAQDLPVCACDGGVYPNACAAYAAGVDVAGADFGKEFCPHSAVPAGRFACGPWYCSAASSFCLYGEGDNGYREVKCVPLPSGCNGAGSCDCVPDLGECAMVAGNGVSGVAVREIHM